MRLNNPQASPKLYWLVLKSVYNGNKVPFIPPLLINNEFILRKNQTFSTTNLHLNNINKVHVHDETFATLLWLSLWHCLSHFCGCEFHENWNIF